MIKSKSLKKGGLDTILAYVVVAIPLFYVLIFMITTLYHFSIQMHLNQTLKETLVLASSYGTLTNGMIDYLCSNISNVGASNWDVKIAVRRLKSDGSGFDTTIYPSYYVPANMTVVDKDHSYYPDVTTIINTLNADGATQLKKGDLVAIEITSQEESLLGRVSRFSIFGSSHTNDLRYSAYREEIIANANPYHDD